MALITIANRKKYMKALGYSYNKSGILKLQKKYFKRSQDKDGMYGKDTDTLLYNAYLVKTYAPHFSLEEFRCPSSCTGYPVRLKKKMVVACEQIRVHYGKKMTLTCGLRCKTYNNSLTGSISTSEHLYGRAFDFYMKGVTDTLSNRKKFIKWAKKNIKGFHYAYGNGYCSYGSYVCAPNMGNAVHLDVA